MSTYQQMGHQSHNLIDEQHLDIYKGVILSPVNYDESRVVEIINSHKDTPIEMIFDPQLYYPNTERGHLPNWSYFPSDVDTADKTSLRWWNRIVSNLSAVINRIQPNMVCSPAIVPRVYSPEYYSLNRDIAKELGNNVQVDGIEVLQTILVRFEWLSDLSTCLEIASISSLCPLNRAYLVFISTDINPRRELINVESLIGSMQLINQLEESGIKVLVGFASSDLILWKAAGASDCATGKFFNLRRFTPSRWEEPSEGGGQLSYWYEESLFSFLRESDLLRIRRADLLSSSSLTNPYGKVILNKIDQRTGEPWLGDSWRQYMYWFADFERRASSESFHPDEILKSAEEIWSILDSRGILMEERSNDGRWLRSWRRALSEWQES